MNIRTRLKWWRLRRRVRWRRLRRRYRRWLDSSPRADGFWIWMQHNEPRARRQLILSITMLYLVIAGIMPAVIFGGVWAGRICFAVFAIASFATWRLQKQVRARFRRYLHSLDYRMCNYCGYILTGLPDDYHCPECHTEYDLESLEEFWNRRLNRLIG